MIVTSATPIQPRRPFDYVEDRGERSSRCGHCLSSFSPDLMMSRNLKIQADGGMPTDREFIFGLGNGAEGYVGLRVCLGLSAAPGAHFAYQEGKHTSGDNEEARRL